MKYLILIILFMNVSLYADEFRTNMGFSIVEKESHMEKAIVGKVVLGDKSVALAFRKKIKDLLDYEYDITQEYNDETGEFTILGLKIDVGLLTDSRFKEEKEDGSVTEFRFDLGVGISFFLDTHEISSSGKDNYITVILRTDNLIGKNNRALVIEAEAKYLVDGDLHLYAKTEHVIDGAQGEQVYGAIYKLDENVHIKLLNHGSYQSLGIQIIDLFSAGK